MINITFDELYSILNSILLINGFKKPDAANCADIFTENTLVGVASHGVNRFPSFIELVKSKHVDPTAKPEKVNSFNALEQWNANFGTGPLNAKLMTERVLELSDQFGIGLVALKNSELAKDNKAIPTNCTRKTGIMGNPESKEMLAIVVAKRPPAVIPKNVKRPANKIEEVIAGVPSSLNTSTSSN